MTTRMTVSTRPRGPNTARRAVSARRPLSPQTVGIAELAELLGMELPPGSAADDVRFATRQVRDKEVIARTGDECANLAVVRFGCFKTLIQDASGNVQGTAFPMAGDTIGADGLATGSHMSDTVALDAGEVIVIPVTRVAELSRRHKLFSRLFYRLISREIVRDQSVLFLLGTLHAEGRVAAFVLEMSDRFGQLGYSRTIFNLRMTRQDIAHYLGLKIETVSRVMTRLRQWGLIAVRHRQIQILDPVALRRVVTEPSGAVRGRRPGRRTAPGYAVLGDARDQSAA